MLSIYFINIYVLNSLCIFHNVKPRVISPCSWRHRRLWNLSKGEMSWLHIPLFSFQNLSHWLHLIYCWFTYPEAILILTYSTVVAVRAGDRGIFYIPYLLFGCQFTRARPWKLSWGSWIQFTPLHLIRLITDVIVFTLLCLD
jgi:hypothetical protein